MSFVFYSTSLEPLHMKQQRPATRKLSILWRLISSWSLLFQGEQIKLFYQQLSSSGYALCTGVGFFCLRSQAVFRPLFISRIYYFCSVSVQLILICCWILLFHKSCKHLNITYRSCRSCSEIIFYNCMEQESFIKLWLQICWIYSCPAHAK